MTVYYIIIISMSIIALSYTISMIGELVVERRRKKEDERIGRDQSKEGTIRK